MYLWAWRILIANLMTTRGRLGCLHKTHRTRCCGLLQNTLALLIAWCLFYLRQSMEANPFVLNPASLIHRLVRADYSRKNSQIRNTETNVMTVTLFSGCVKKRDRIVIGKVRRMWWQNLQELCREPRRRAHWVKQKDPISVHLESRSTIIIYFYK